MHIFPRISLNAVSSAFILSLAASILSTAWSSEKIQAGIKESNLEEISAEIYKNKTDSRSQALLRCSSQSDCPERCTCDAVYEYCYDMDLFREMFDECPRCRDPQSDCTLIGDTCNSGACFSCGNHALVTSQNVCNSAGQQNPPLSSSQTNPGTSVGLGNVKCVETEWLKRNGFSQGILREFGVAKTLCINGLPCGTEGHLLRDCNVDGICKLVTYRDVCSRRGNCTVKYAEVSLISHKIDWSTVEEKECREQGRTLRLTSLSEDVEGRFIPISRFVASIGENAVEKGYGGVIDLVVLAILDIIEVLNFIRSEIPKMLTK